MNRTEQIIDKIENRESVKGTVVVLWIVNLLIVSTILLLIDWQLGTVVSSKSGQFGISIHDLGMFFLGGLASTFVLYLFGRRDKIIVATPSEPTQMSEAQLARYKKECRPEQPIYPS